MSKAVAKTEKNTPALPAEMAGMFDEINYDSVEAKDVKIPKILLMQAMSKLVNEDGTHKAGDIVNSISHNVMGSAREKDAKSLRFIPIHMFKTWVTFEKIKDELEYIETLALTPQNSNMEWEETLESGQVIKRVKNVNFFVFLEKDLGNPLAKPYVLTFRSTSLKSATLLESHFADCKIAKSKGIQFDDEKKAWQVPMGMVFELGGKTEKNDKGTFFVFTVTPASPTSMEVIGEVMPWYKVAVAADPNKDIDNSDVQEKAAKEKLAAPPIRDADFKEF